MSIIEAAKAEELIIGKNVSYILQNINDFSSSDYNVMQNAQDLPLVKCKKVLFNGKLQLFYLTEGLIPIVNYLSTIKKSECDSLLKSLMNSLLQVKNYGFLSVGKISLNVKHIFIDRKTRMLKLLYLPVTYNAFDMHSDGEELSEVAMKEILRQLEAKHFVFDWKKLNEEEFTHEGIGEGTEQDYKVKFSDHQFVHRDSTLRLQSLNDPRQNEILVTKKEFVVGKKKESVDGHIDNSAMVSRIHGKILYKDYQFYLRDLSSTNGTFLNNNRLVPEKDYLVHDGDIIGFANCLFLARIK